MVAFVGWSGSAHAQAVECPCDNDARRLGRLITRSTAEISLKRGDAAPKHVTLPVCIEYDDVYTVLSGDVLEDIRNDNEVSRPESGQSKFSPPEVRHRFPPLPVTQSGAKKTFASITAFFFRGKADGCPPRQPFRPGRCLRTRNE